MEILTHCVLIKPLLPNSKIYNILITARRYCGFQRLLIVCFNRFLINFRTFAYGFFFRKNRFRTGSSFTRRSRTYRWRSREHGNTRHLRLWRNVSNRQSPPLRTLYVIPYIYTRSSNGKRRICINSSCLPYGVVRLIRVLAG